MTLRDGGILVARGLAMVFLAEGLAYIVQGLEFLPGPWGNRGWQTPVAYLAQAALALLFAGFLWRGSKSFTGDIPESTQGPPIDQSGLLRALTAAIAVYWAFAYADKLSTLATTYLEGRWLPSYMGGFYRDVVMLAIAAVAFIWAGKGMRGVSRVISYPRSEPDAEMPDQDE